MTIAQTKARRQFWGKQNDRYRKKRKDPEASKRKQQMMLEREKERIGRKAKAKK